MNKTRQLLDNLTDTNEAQGEGDVPITPDDVMQVLTGINVVEAGHDLGFCQLLNKYSHRPMIRPDQAWVNKTFKELKDQVYSIQDQDALWEIYDDFAHYFLANRPGKRPVGEANPDVHAQHWQLAQQSARAHPQWQQIRHIASASLVSHGAEEVGSSDINHEVFSLYRQYDGDWNRVLANYSDETDQGGRSHMPSIELDTDEIQRDESLENGPVEQIRFSADRDGFEAVLDRIGVSWDWDGDWLTVPATEYGRAEQALEDFGIGVTRDEDDGPARTRFS